MDRILRAARAALVSLAHSDGDAGDGIGNRADAVFAAAFSNHLFLYCDGVGNWRDSDGELRIFELHRAGARILAPRRQIPREDSAAEMVQEVPHHGSDARG